MKVSGFTFLKNGVKLGYPFVQSIKSALPLVDEFVIALGPCDDDTEAQINAIGDSKIRIIHTQWCENMRDRGYIYGQQKMIAQFNCTGDWCLYIEGDEVLHQDEIENIRSRMTKYKDVGEVEAMFFDFFHFYGDTNTLGISGYRRAPRIIKSSVRSYAPDGLFFVVMDKNKRGRYPRAVHAGGNVYHYGHVRPKSKMAQKVTDVGQYWGDDEAQFDGYGQIDSAVLRPFTGTHPAIMQEWVTNEGESNFQPDPSYQLTRRDKKVRLKLAIEDRFGIEISKKHYVDLTKTLG